MNRTIYLLCLLGFSLFATNAISQSKVEQLETQVATAEDKDKPDLYNQLAQLLLYSNTNKSLMYANSALTSSKAIKNLGTEASAHVNLGLANVRLGKRDAALKNFNSGLTIYEEYKSDEGKAYVYIQLAICYEGMTNYSPALTYFQKAIVIHKKLNNNQGLSRSYVGVGDHYLKKGKTDDAVASYKKSLDYYKAINDNEGLARAYSKIGIAYSNFGNYTEAKKMLQKAAEIAKSKNLISLLGEINKNLVVVEKNLEVSGSKSEFEQIEEAKVEEKIQSLEVKSEQLESQTSNFLSEIEGLTEENKIKAYEVKVKEDALRAAKLIEEKQAQDLELASADKKAQDLELAAGKAELEKKAAEVERKNLIAAGLVGGLVFLAAIAFLILARYQQKKKANNQLEQQNAEITQQKEEITGQKVELERSSRQITDSIDYAKRIQSALLSSEAKIRTILPESFILFKPKAVVSGDFYWVKEQQDRVFFAAADCTGHGVPGAFMSIISNNVLNGITTENVSATPGEILKRASDEIIYRLQDKESQVVKASDGTKTEWEVKDGMDIALCALNKSTLQLQYAGAHNPLYIIRNGELIEYRGDRLFIGNTTDETVFKTHDIQLQKGDMLYVFSDGFPDQRGGPAGKKFYYQPFQAMLLEIHQHGMDQQQEHLDKVINDWIGGKEQIDDILIFGVRV
ncbi:MAG: tetratricopeptide repeat protein [Flavobacteriales bacterium]|nr:tetratricopeptide repeat protein [Flavobacteriales bacterium]